MKLSRRSFLQAGIGAAGWAGALSRFGLVDALAQTSPDYRALVCVFLNGGNDGNNLIVPLDASQYQAYAAARGELALSAASLLPITAITGNAAYGLHPALPKLQGLFQQKKLAVVANTGMLVQPLNRSEYQQKTAPVPAILFSHFDQQRSWHGARALDNYRTGWGGRAADMVKNTNATSTFPAALSLSGGSTFCQGRDTRPGTVIPGATGGLTGFDVSTESMARRQAFEDLLTSDLGLSLIQSASNTTSEGIRLAREIESATANGSNLTTPFPSTTLGRQLEQVAKIIKVKSTLGIKRQIFFCSLDGFDNHTNQLFDHNRLLADLNGALAAFYDATIELGVSDSVTTFTESEFNRTLQASAGGGSDHGWGSHHIIFGGAVKGGDLYGRFPTLALGGPDDAASRGVWIPTTSADQYGATLASWFGVTASGLATVFPNLSNFTPANLGFLL